MFRLLNHVSVKVISLMTIPLWVKPVSIRSSMKPYEGFTVRPNRDVFCSFILAAVGLLFSAFVFVSKSILLRSLVSCIMWVDFIRSTDVYPLPASYPETSINIS